MKFNSICNGEIVSITDVPDVVFSDRMMGDGVAFKPSTGRIVSPISGEVIFLHPTSGHAVGLKSDEGFEILIHFGLQSFQIPEGVIKRHIEVGQTISQGDLLLEVDLSYFEAHTVNTITPVVFTSGERVELIESHRAVIEGEGNLIR